MRRHLSHQTTSWVPQFHREERGGSVKTHTRYGPNLCLCIGPLLGLSQDPSTGEMAIVGGPWRGVGEGTALSHQESGWVGEELTTEPGIRSGNTQRMWLAEGQWARTTKRPLF